MPTNNNTIFINRLTYRRELRAIARFFNLSSVFRKWYFFYARPRGGILNLRVKGLKSQFFVKTPGELRILESMGGGGSGEKHVLETLISNIHTGDVFYDVGGHVGLYTIFLSKAVGLQGKVIAFEPEKQNYEHFIDNLKINIAENVRVFQKALGEKNESIKVYLGEDGGNFSLLKKVDKSGGYEQVSVVNGDEFIEKEKLPIPNAVKIDVEGYEYSVINGLRDTLSKPECRLLCCEIHTTILPEGITAESVINLLKSLGFDKIDVYFRDQEYHVIAFKK